MRLDFKFDDRLFQRGQMWRECVEEWLAHRNAFLQSVQEPPLLEKTLKTLNQQPLRRYAIVYSTNSLDSLLSLPFVGSTFHTAKNAVTRFFCHEHFFPLFAESLERGLPRILVLDRNGSVKPVWGPRPLPVTRHLGEAMNSGVTQDRALTDYARNHYPLVLDQSISAALKDAL